MRGELYFAYILRYYQYSGQPSIARSFQTFLDIPTWIGNTIFISRIDASIKKIKLSEEKYIEEHSVLPFYRIFLSEKQYEGFKYQFLHGRNASYINKLHHTFYKEDSLENHTLKYCPMCHREEQGYADIQKYHQIPGVKVCVKHQCYLNEVSILKKTRLKQPQEWDLSVNNCKEEWLLGIAKDVSYILQERPQIHREWIIENLRAEIWNLQKRNGVEALKGILEKGYADLPEEYQCYRRRFRLERFLDPLLEPSISQMEFLILIRMLFGSFKEFAK